MTKDEPEKPKKGIRIPLEDYINFKIWQRDRAKEREEAEAKKKKPPKTEEEELDEIEEDMEEEETGLM